MQGMLTAFGAGAVITGRMVGKIVPQIGRANTLTLGFVAAMLADGLLFGAGDHPFILVVSVALLGIGFMLAHSTLLTMATEFAKMARGTAMSLVAFCFMGGGGIGTAIGGKIAAAYGLPAVFQVNGVALAVTLILSFVLITGPVVAPQLAPETESS